MDRGDFFESWKDTLSDAAHRYSLLFDVGGEGYADRRLRVWLDRVWLPAEDAPEADDDAEAIPPLPDIGEMQRRALEEVSAHRAHTAEAINAIAERRTRVLTNARKLGCTSKAVATRLLCSDAAVRQDKAWKAAAPEGDSNDA